MGIFGKKKEEPITDPKPPGDGLPPDPKDGDPPNAEFVKKEDFDALKGTMDQINLKMEVFGQPQPAPVAPAAPAAPKIGLEESVSKLNDQVADIDSKIDKAVFDGKGVADLIKKRDALNEKKMELKFDHKFEAFRADGVSVLDNLSGQITEGKMPHLTVPEIKKDFEASLASMAPEVRMNPEVRLAAYNLSVGQNVDKITELKLQESLRKEDPPDSTTDPSPRSARKPPGDGKGGIPAPETILSKDNLDAIKSAGHNSIDSYYKKLGYEGWDDHYEQNKDFYEEGEA